jgi:Rrf2 family transcriptional regulator, iron-sulfur cluster assembly transcription factor
MTLNKSARYALYATLEMALADSAPVTVAGVAARYGIPPTALAKVLQQLVRVGLATGSRGVGGGYRLAKPASTLSVLDVVSIFDPPRPAGQCLLGDAGHPGCAHPEQCGVRALFDEVDELVRCTFASVSLVTLTRRAVRLRKDRVGRQRAEVARLR